MKINNRIFRSLHRLRYIMRVKHFRGRSVHSPFLYSVVRECLMKNNKLPIDQTLHSQLVERGFSSHRAERVCRIFTHLNYNNYSFDCENYKGEDMLIITGEIDQTCIQEIAKNNKTEKKTICVIVSEIYSSRDRYRSWNKLSTISGGVAVDLYHTGYLFIDFYLNKQKFKMRF